MVRDFYDEYVTKKDPAGRRGRVMRLKMATAKKVVTERDARRVDQKANPPLRCNSPTSASNTAQ